MPTITIDGKQIEFTGEPTILEVATGACIHIPTLCYLKDLLPIGSCRVCIVEVEGATHPMASCTTPATDGQVVTTTSPRLEALRKQAVQFVLVNHPLDCPVCDKAGECGLQDVVMELSVERQPFDNFTYEKTGDDLSKLIVRNDSRCIRCGRCIAICHEVQGVGAFRFNGRGWETHVDTQDGGPLACEFCGQCISVCPVGALLSKPFLHSARVWELTKIRSACGYCGTGCVLEYGVRKSTARKPVRVRRVTSPRETNPVNGGNLCVRGTFGYDAAESEKRITTPRIRSGGKWREVSWEDALRFAADGLKRVTKTGGPEGVAVLGSSRMTNEAAWLLKKIGTECLQTPHLDSPAGNGLFQAQQSMREISGQGASTATLEDLAKAETIVLLGCDLAVEMPVASLAVLKAARLGDASLVCAYPRTTKLHSYAKAPLVYQPGRETSLLASLASCLIDRTTVSPEGVQGFDEYTEAAKEVNLPEAAAQAGLTAGDLVGAADVLKSAGRIVFVVGNAFLRGPGMEERMRWLGGLMAATGAFGGEGSGMFYSMEDSNAQGVLDMGVYPAEGGKTGPGVLAEAFDGRLQGMLACGLDPIKAFPGMERNRQAISHLEFFACISAFETEATGAADVVLPSAVLYERSGTLTSAERRVQRLRPALSPRGEGRMEWEILKDLGSLMGLKMECNSSEEIFTKLKQEVLGYDVVEQTDLEGWGKVLTPEKRAESVQLKRPSPLTVQPEEDDSLLLFCGPELFQADSLSQYSQNIAKAVKDVGVSMNPVDAEALGISEGDLVLLRSGAGAMECTAHISEDIKPKTLFAPCHMDGLSALFPPDTNCIARVLVKKV